MRLNGHFWTFILLHQIVMEGWCPGAGCHNQGKTRHLADAVGQNHSADLRGFSESASHSLNSIPEAGTEPPPDALRSPDTMTGVARDLFQMIGTATSDGQLVECNRKIWGAFAAKLIDESAADYLSRYVHARRPPKADPSKHRSVTSYVRGAVSGFKARRYQRSPCREASRSRRRVLAGSGALPWDIRREFPEGQAAVLCIIGMDAKRGVCASSIDSIAARAGVCRTTVQTAILRARRLGLVQWTARPVRGRKNLTNLIEIVSAAWTKWLARGVQALRRIGSKLDSNAHPTKTSESITVDSQRAVAPRGALEGKCRRKILSSPTGELDQQQKMSGGLL